MNRRRTVVFAAATLALLLGGSWSIHRVWLAKHSAIPLSESIRRGDLGAIQRYLASGGSPNAEVEIYGHRMTMLKEAVLDRETAIALALLDGGADFGASGARMVEVGANGMTEVVDRLLPAVAVSSVVLTGVTTAAGSGYFDTVQSYVRFTEGRRTDEWAQAFGDAANNAMLAGYDDVARMLIDAGARSAAMLHVAARFSSAGMVRYLIANGADPMQVVEPPVAVVRERTPLDFAWKRYKEHAAEEQQGGFSAAKYLRNEDAKYVLFELLRAGAQTSDAELRAAARDGLAEIAATPVDAQLTAAARIGFIDVVADLLDRDTRWTALTLREAVIAALKNDHDDIARMLLEHGAPIDGGVLHVAANASSAGLVRYLLRKGANPAERVDGKTPVQWWLEKNSTQGPEFVLHELIVGGADVCWLRTHERELWGLSAMILKGSAPQCWDGAPPASK